MRYDDICRNCVHNEVCNIPSYKLYNMVDCEHKMTNKKTSKDYVIKELEKLIAKLKGE